MKISLVGKIVRIFNFKKIALALAIMFLAQFSSSAIATGCNQISPNFKELQDEYYIINALELSKENIQAIERFYDEISGRWRGEYSILECKGSEKDPVAVVNTGRVRSMIQQDSIGVLIIEDEIDFKTDQPLTARKINTQRWEHIISFDLNEKHKYSFAEKFRNRSSSGASVLVEHIYSFDRTGYKTLTITRSTYHGGYFSFEENWVLKK